MMRLLEKKKGETKQHYQAFNKQQAKKVSPACTFTLLIPLSVYPSDSITWQGISDKNHKVRTWYWEDVLNAAAFQQWPGLGP